MVFRPGLAAVLAIAGAGCGRLGFDAEARGGDADVPADVAADTGPPCDPNAPFGTPVPIAELNDPDGAPDGTLRLDAGELTGYFWSTRTGSTHIYYASRTALDQPFTIAAVTGLNTTGNDLDPSLSADGSVLVFRHNAPGDDLWVATRDTPTSFSGAAAIANLNVGAPDDQPFLVGSTDELFYSSLRSGAGDLYRSLRTGTTFTDPTVVTELASPGDEEGDPALSFDGTTLYFRSNAAASQALGFNIYVATRPTVSDPFGTPVLVPSVNSDADDGPSFVSRDGCRLYLSSDRAGNNDIFVATRGT